MPDPNPNPNPAGGADPNANPNPNQNPAATPFDPSKVGDEEFAKIFDDPRTFAHPRFKELTEAAKELKALKKAQADANEQKLADEKKHEELATLRAKERDDARGAAKTTQIENAIIKAAAKKGVTDLDAAVKLIDQANIKVNEDGSITGVTEAVDALIADKKYLVGAKGDIGRGTNPPDPNANEGTFTISQMQDPVFYQAHQAEILKAVATGKIVDDRTQ